MRRIDFPPRDAERADGFVTPLNDRLVDAGTARLLSPARQPQRARLRPDRAGGGDPAGVSGLSAGPGLLARLHRRQIGRRAASSAWQLRSRWPTTQVFWLSVFNTIFYTVVASVLKFALGLWLALLLNRQLPLKSLIRAIVLLPFVVPTALSAIAFWWIYDSQFSIISWALMQARR